MSPTAASAAAASSAAAGTGAGDAGGSAAAPTAAAAAGAAAPAAGHGAGGDGGDANGFAAEAVTAAPDGGRLSSADAAAGAPVAAQAVAAARRDALLVGAVVKAVLAHASHGAAVDALPSRNAGDYEVKISEDGVIDPDFPELDWAVPITAIGVNEFMLCETGTGRECVRLTIPMDVVRWRPTAGGDRPDVSVTCTPCSAASGSAPFVVRLQG